MKKKIVIIGALGYIGTELCKIYSGESWHNSVIAIDSRFISERVSPVSHVYHSFSVTAGLIYKRIGTQCPYDRRSKLTRPFT